MRVETAFEIALPVAETLRITRTRFGPGTEAVADSVAATAAVQAAGPGAAAGSGAATHAAPHGKKIPRLVLSSGTHGDELEGLYVCAIAAEFLSKNEDQLDGWIDLYPTLNPLGVDTITRTLPAFEVDLNRSFKVSPGVSANFVAALTEGIAASLLGADAVVDIHASNVFLREIPQVRVSEQFANQSWPLAEALGLDFLWIHDAVTVLENTLSHTLNAAGTPCLVVEMGVGMRITPSYCYALLEGILRLAKHLGIWRGPVSPGKAPIKSSDGSIQFINAEAPGIFVPEVSHSSRVRSGELLGRVVSIRDGKTLQEARADRESLVFTLREYPIVQEGSLLARLYAESPKK